MSKDTIAGLEQALEEAEKALTRASQALMAVNRAEGYKALQAAQNCLKALVEYRG